MATRVVKLALISDFVCSNCFITHHELSNAISYCKDTLKLPLAVELEYLPFRLISPTRLSENSPKIDKITFMTQHLGKDVVTKIETAINKWAEEKGIPIKLSGVVSQSTRAHRLCQKAYKMGGQQLQVPVFCALFKAYLEDGQDIADYSVLADIAQKVGMMSREEALKFLQSDELEKEVNDMCEAARSKGITGVPITIIDGRWAITGSQSSDVYIQIFKKLAAGGCAAPPPMPSGPVDTGIFT
jgi:predicted DsbA family dithiol-disulfide isomerase